MDPLTLYTRAVSQSGRDISDAARARVRQQGLLAGAEQFVKRRRLCARVFSLQFLARMLSLSPCPLLSNHLGIYIC